jgi:dual specificity protein kinase YAK1
MYKKCYPGFRYHQEMKYFKHVLIKPSNRVQNWSLDNANGDYIFSVGDIIYDTTAASSGCGTGSRRKYLVESLLDQGSFGQVLKCMDLESRATYAIIVIKNQPAYTRQAQLEFKILQTVSYSLFSFFFFHLQHVIILFFR